MVVSNWVDCSAKEMRGDMQRHLSTPAATTIDSYPIDCRLNPRNVIRIIWRAIQKETIGRRAVPPIDDSPNYITDLIPPPYRIKVNISRHIL